MFGSHSMVWGRAEMGMGAESQLSTWSAFYSTYGYLVISAKLDQML